MRPHSLDGVGVGRSDGDDKEPMDIDTEAAVLAGKASIPVEQCKRILELQHEEREAKRVKAATSLSQV